MTTETLRKLHDACAKLINAYRINKCQQNVNIFFTVS